MNCSNNSGMISFLSRLEESSLVCVCVGGGVIRGVELNSEIDPFLLHLACGRGRPVPAHLCVPVQNVTPSINLKTSPLEIESLDSSL